jgi:hypothetical protein
VAINTNNVPSHGKLDVWGNGWFSGSVTAAGGFAGDGSGLSNLNASSLASGTVPTARLGSGSASSSTFLRGDQQWATPAGSGNVTGTGSSTAGNFAALSNGSTTGITDSLFSATSFDVANAAHDATNALYAALNAAKADKATTITINGTGNQLNSSAGAQDLSANHIWTLSLPSTLVAPGTVTAVTSINSPKYFLGPWVFGTNATDGTFLLSNGPNAQFILSIGTNGVLTGNAAGFTNLNGTNVIGQLTNNTTGNAATATSATSATTATSATFVTTSPLTNSVQATNLITDSSTLSPTGNATNYTADLKPPPGNGTLTIYSAATNINLSLTGTNKADWGRSLFINNTSAVNCNLTFTFNAATNQNYNAVVSNGWCGFFNFWNPDTTGTNVLVSDAGRYHR